MSYGLLIDTTKCIGCRGCQVACKQSNDLLGETTGFRAIRTNPPDLTANTWSLVEFYEVPKSQPAAGVAVREAPVHALPGAGLRLGLPGGCAAEDGRRAGDLRRQALHRLPVLHDRLPVQRAQVRVGQRRAAGPEVRDVRRAAGGWRAAGVRQGVPHGRGQVRPARRAAG